MLDKGGLEEPIKLRTSELDNLLFHLRNVRFVKVNTW